MKVTEKVLRVLRAEHISDEELGKMLDEAAITRIEGGNARYCHWLFKTNPVTGAVEDMRLVEMVEIGQGPAKVIEEHDACEGAGCHACGWVGSFVRRLSDETASRLANVERS
jgi:hypothetical protein